MADRSNEKTDPAQIGPSWATHLKGYPHPGSFITLPDQGGTIHLQFGHPQEEGRNGCFVVDVLRALRENLRVYQQDGHPLRCNETAMTLTHLTQAIESIDRRKTDRKARNVHNTDQE